jgi:hypothetical protein
MADIEPIRKDGPSWGSKAAAGDALERVPNEAPFIALWIATNEKGEQVLKWSKANFTYGHYSFAAIALLEFAQRIVRDAMDRER